MPRRDVFEIAYTGLMLRGRSAKPVVDAVDALVRLGRIPGDRIDVRFYGTQPEAFRLQVDREGLVKHPKLMPRVSLTEAIERQRAAAALLVLQLTEPDKAAGVFPGKVFEYLAAGRPILCYPADPDGIGRLLSTTGAGVSCQTQNDLQQVILRWYREWERSGDVRLSRNEGEVAKFSREVQVARLAGILDEVVAKRSR
jgi:glycosyltransferase involved in cell wall biosynthesis